MCVENQVRSGQAASRRREATTTPPADQNQKSTDDEPDETLATGVGQEATVVAALPIAVAVAVVVVVAVAIAVAIAIAIAVVIKPGAASGYLSRSQRPRKLPNRGRDSRAPTQPAGFGIALS